MSLPRAAAECVNCLKKDRWILHHVRLRGIHRRLCTSCVLRLHSASFCPLCFAFYDSAPPHPSKRLSCTNCSSFTHTHCSPSSPNPFLCPPCKDASFSFFDVKTGNKDAAGGLGGGGSGDVLGIDKKLADALICASKIAAASMGKAVIVARAEAERRVREAAVARKRAREALEHLASLFNREENLRRKEGGIEVSGATQQVPPKEKVEAASQIKKDVGSAKDMSGSATNPRPGNNIVVQRMPVIQTNAKPNNHTSK